MHKQRFLTLLLIINLGLSLGGALFVGRQAARAHNPQAQTVPQTISYQGLLQDEQGLPLNGSHNLGFAVYAAAGGGPTLWQETHARVQPSQGVFAMKLGANTPFPQGLFAELQRWLEISVDGLALEPRQAFSSVPDAMNADMLDRYDSSDLMGLPGGLLAYLDGAPPARTEHAAVWIGDRRMIGGGSADSGALYNPTTDTWEPVTANGAPPQGRSPKMLWTGAQVIFWQTTPSFAGYLYDPAADSWTSMNLNGAPLSAYRGFWTGSELVIGEANFLYF